MILNEQTGYFYQVSGWALNCAIIGAVLADLSLKSRIDSDLLSMRVIDSSPTGEPELDWCLNELSSYQDEERGARFWIEHLAVHAEKIIDTTLARLVQREFLNHHEGGFYSINYTSVHDTKQQEIGTDIPPADDLFVKLRIREVIFTDVIPDPRDVLIIGLLNVCDVIRFIFAIDEHNERRIQQVCKMELISRTISEAVKQSIVSPSLQHTPISRKIPKASLIKLLTNKHFWDGNLPAMYASLVNEYGPVFQMQPPFQKPKTFVGGHQVNRWVHRNARMFMTSGNYFRELEKVCGASGLITSLDGADHFRMRKVLQGVYSLSRFYERLNDMYRLNRHFMSESKWQPGTELEVQRVTRLMVNMQMTHILVSTDTQDIFEEIVKWKEAASNSHVAHITPKILMRTPAMKRRFKHINSFVRRVEQNHTPYQRAEAVRELADDLISLHASDPQFLPEQNLPFMLAAAPVLQSIYLGDVLGFALFEMSRHPDLAARIREEANNLFAQGDPVKDDFTPEAYDVTRRFLMECLRLYPVVTVMLRNVANSCVVENYSLPVGERVYILQSATHYMSDSFPDPYKFDIDRYLPPREEHRGHGFAPYGLGTHLCVGYAWMQMQLTVTLLMIAYYFEFGSPPKNYELKINPVPTMSVSKKLKLRIANQFHELPS